MKYNNMGLQPKRLEQFFKFVAERQLIWFRKEMAKLPRPWTNDKILRDYFFCNVYRELDRGTQFAIKEVMEKSPYPLSALVFRTLVYRMFNEPETFTALERNVDFSKFNGGKAGKLLTSRQIAGHTVFRSAWMTSGAGVGSGPGSKARAYCMTLEKICKDRRKIAYDIQYYDSMEEAWKYLSKLQWFGSFSAYQVVLDLSYTGRFRKWKDKDWVFPGPGAKMGIYWLMGLSPIKRKGARDKSGKRISFDECERIILHLRDKQDMYFKIYKCNFVPWEGNPLDVHNIEYSLCEFNKYMRASRGGKKKKFTPRTKVLYSKITSYE